MNTYSRARKETDNVPKYIPLYEMQSGGNVRNKATRSQYRQSKNTLTPSYIEEEEPYSTISDCNIPTTYDRTSAVSKLPNRHHTGYDTVMSCQILGPHQSDNYTYNHLTVSVDGEYDTLESHNKAIARKPACDTYSHLNVRVKPNANMVGENGTPECHNIAIAFKPGGDSHQNVSVNSSSRVAREYDAADINNHGEPIFKPESDAKHQLNEND